jgi:hypothetical protein
MNTQKKEEVKAPTQGEQSYEEITAEKIENMLVELSNTQYWPYLVKYYDARCILAESSLASLDPFKNPTEMARNQGFRNGIRDVEQFVIAVKQKRADAEKESQEKK